MDHFSRRHKLFFILSGIFIANVLIAEFVGVKIFSLAESLKLRSASYSIFGQTMELSFTAGVLIWPVVFVLTDIINDYFGTKGVRFITFLSAAIIIYAFLAVKLAIVVSPASWWVTSNASAEIPNANSAFRFIFGQGQNIIIGSLVAFLVGQFSDAFIFKKIKQTGKGNLLWYRATASTLISQLIDSFVVIFIAFKLGQGWTWGQTISVALNNYFYKGIVALLSIPFLLLIHKMVEKYLNINEK